MKLLPVASLLLLLLTTLEARPKPAGELWLVGGAWRGEKGEQRAVEPLEDSLLCDMAGHGPFFGSIPRRMEDASSSGT